MRKLLLATAFCLLASQAFAAPQHVTCMGILVEEHVDIGTVYSLDEASDLKDRKVCDGFIPKKYVKKVLKECEVGHHCIIEGIHERILDEDKWLKIDHVEFYHS